VQCSRDSRCLFIQSMWRYTTIWPKELAPQSNPINPLAKRTIVKITQPKLIRVSPPNIFALVSLLLILAETSLIIYPTHAPSGVYGRQSLPGARSTPIGHLRAQFILYHGSSDICHEGRRSRDLVGICVPDIEGACVPQWACACLGKVQEPAKEKQGQI